MGHSAGEGDSGKRRISNFGRDSFRPAVYEPHMHVKIDKISVNFIHKLRMTDNRDTHEYNVPSRLSIADSSE